MVVTVHVISRLTNISQVLRYWFLFLLTPFLYFSFLAHSVNVVANGDSSAYFNAEASFTCTLADPTGVLQVTWQRLFKDESVENLATYSKRFGPQIIEPHKNKVVLREASLNSTSITLKNVSWSDEACYICSFNVYPSGSRRKQTCLTVQGNGLKNIDFYWNLTTISISHHNFAIFN
uniref:Ig-like domain-containing protein n=1 Tax=Esox lucius TaxID=8010 RepID=A0AAY5KZB7_ESOLU